MDWHRRNLAHLPADLKQLDFERRYVDPVPLAATVLQAYKYESSIPNIATSHHDGQRLMAWLKTDPPLLNGSHPQAGFRLILLKRVGSEEKNRALHRLFFSKDVWDALRSYFGLHYSFVRTIIRGKADFSSTTCTHHSSQNRLNGFIIRTDDVIGNDILLSTALDEKTQIMNAVLHGCTSRDEKLIREWLELLQPDVFHPLLLPALALDLMRTKHTRMIDGYSDALVRISGATRQYDSLPEHETLEDVNNYNQKTKEVLQLHQDTGDLALALGQTRKQVFKILKILEGDAFANFICPVRKNSDFSVQLRERLEDISGVYEDMEKMCDQVTSDCNMLMGAIYNLIAQRQNQINYDIATAAKRDSSAMKAIAVLTMLLLPGTFVASFFAMPLLNWNANLAPEDAGRVINPRFKYYWAVTLPLTAFVMTFWFVWNSYFVEVEATQCVDKNDGRQTGIRLSRMPPLKRSRP